MGESFEARDCESECACASLALCLLGPTVLLFSQKQSSCLIMSLTVVDEVPKNPPKADVLCDILQYYSFYDKQFLSSHLHLPSCVPCWQSETARTTYL